MVEPSPKESSSESLLEVRSVSDAVLSDWNKELVAVDGRSSKTRAEKQAGSPSKGSTEAVSGTKDPTKSLIRYAQLQKKGAQALRIDSEVRKTGANSSRSSREKSATKERLSGSQQSAPSGHSSNTEVAALLREGFSDLAVQMNKGFSSLLMVKYNNCFTKGFLRRLSLVMVRTFLPFLSGKKRFVHIDLESKRTECIHRVATCYTSHQIAPRFCNCSRSFIAPAKRLQ